VSRSSENPEITLEIAKRFEKVLTSLNLGTNSRHRARQQSRLEASVGVIKSISNQSKLLKIQSIKSW